jgi:hypothetical protein
VVTDVTVPAIAPDAVGTHTLQAVATDNAGNSSTLILTYVVDPWTLTGFYKPVDPNPTIINVVKAGSTVPLKFEIFIAGTEQTDSALITSFTSKQVACGTYPAAEDEDITTTGGTGLRYDFTEGQFINNWKTPNKKGYCFDVKMTTADGSEILAHFRLK